MAPTEGQLATWDATLWEILGEMAEAYGETPAGNYGPEVEMATRLAWLAIDRELAALRLAEATPFAEEQT
jgi:hypothetical protein